MNSLKRKTVVALGLAALGATSCGPMSNQNGRAVGAASGAAGGAALGAIIGKQSNRTAEGAAIGALAGTLVGADNGANWFGGDQTILKTERE